MCNRLILLKQALEVFCLQTQFDFDMQIINSLDFNWAQQLSFVLILSTNLYYLTCTLFIGDHFHLLQCVWDSIFIQTT